MRIMHRLWAFRHRCYEEMCVLAATGQLGGAQMYELNEHIIGCRECRSLVESAAQLSAQVVPLLADHHAPALDAAAPGGMRERFLARLALEEAGERALGGGCGYAFPERGGIAATSATPRKARLRTASRFGWAAGAVAACALVGLIGFHAGEGRGIPALPRVAPAEQTGALIAAASALDSEADRVNALERQNLSVEVELAKTRENLQSAEMEKQSLQSNLGGAKAQLAAATVHAEDASKRSASELQAANGQIAALQNRIRFLNQRLVDSEMGAFSQQKTADRLKAELRAAETDLERERELKSAKLELGDLAAARNLHIVDVYDADSTGERKRSFGRVFYVQGKSLVFYAFDLNDRGRFKTRVVFRVWGGKTGDKEVTHSLGILHQDKDGQSRWTMTFDDPAVLAQINSVFVTAEAANKHYDRPHGRKILFAFLGSQPNHP